MPRKRNLQDSHLLQLLRTSRECARLLTEALGNRQAEMPLHEGFSQRTVRRILPKDLKFHPLKMVMGQALNYQDAVNRKTLCENLMTGIGNEDINHVPMTDKIKFHLCGCQFSELPLLST
jgi:hypothetical protein